MNLARSTFGRVIGAALLATCLGAASADAAQFRFAGSRDLPGMEPYHTDVFVDGFLSAMYDSLMGIRSDGTLEPKLATSWEQVEPTRWRFKLRQGVKFHEGERFSADDVLFSFKRILHPNALGSAVKQVVKETVKVDDYTVDMVTNYVDPILPRSIQNIAIMSKAWAEKNNAVEVAPRAAKEETYATRHINGTGAFKLVKWDPGVSIEMAVNPDYWGGKRTDKMDSAKYFVISNASTQLAALLSKEVDLVTDLPAALIDRAEQAPGVKVLRGRQTTTIMLGMDQARNELLESSVKGKNPFKDVRVRRAFYLAIDADAIVQRIQRGAGYVAELTVAPEAAGHDPAQNVHAKIDIPRAKALMAEAGYAEGFQIGFDCPSGVYVNDEAMCQAIAVMLAQINVKAEIKMAPRGPYFTKIQQPKFESTFFLYSSATASFDAFSQFDRILRTRDEANKIAMSNVSGWSDKNFDAIVDQLRTEIDPAKRQALYNAAWKLVREGLPYIVLFQPAVLWASQSNIEVPVDPVNRVLLNNVKLN